MLAPIALEAQRNHIRRKLSAAEKFNSLLRLQPGLTALVGENDAGKTAVIDALRLVLGTRDQETYRVDEADFHQPADGTRRSEIRICCKFDGLTLADSAAFAEYLTYEDRDGRKSAVLYVNWKAVVCPAYREQPQQPLLLRAPLSSLA